MKLSTYAKQLGISYQTAWRLFKDGKLNAYLMSATTSWTNIDAMTSWTF
jgi:predicted site-specific integrase-resolvase